MGDQHSVACARRIRDQVSEHGGSSQDAALAIHEHCGVSLLRAHRYASDWTLIEVAERLRAILRSAGQPAEGLAHQRVSQWESGLDLPNYRYLDALCRLYRSRPDLLGFGHDYSVESTSASENISFRTPRRDWSGVSENLPDSDEDEMERRRLLQSLATTALGGMAVTPLIQSLRTVRENAASLLQEQSVSETTVDDWEMVVHDYGYFAGRPPVLTFISQMMFDFDELRRVLSRRQPLDHQRRLYHAMGKLAGLIANNLTDGLDAPREAHAWFHIARLAAEESGDRTLRAWVLAKEGMSYIWYGRPAERAVEMLRAAQVMAGSAPNTVSVYAAAVEAIAQAQLGRRADAMAATSRAELMFGHLPAEKIAVNQFGYYEQLLRYHKETALTAVGETQRALEEQRRALELATGTDRTDLAVIRIDQATCMLQSGDFDEACRMAGRAILELPAEDRNGVAVFRARQVADRVAPRARNLQAARDLRDILRS